MSRSKYLNALGMITSGFQQLEFYLSLFAWGLMGKDRIIGQTITAQTSFSSLVKLVSNLFRARTYDDELNQELKEILSWALDLEKARNRVVHSVYLQESDHPEDSMLRIKIVSKLHKGLVQHWEVMSTEDLMDIAVEIAQLSEKLAKFIGRVRVPLSIEFSTEERLPQVTDNDDVPF